MIIKPISKRQMKKKTREERMMLFLVTSVEDFLFIQHDLDHATFSLISPIKMFAIKIKKA